MNGSGFPALPFTVAIGSEILLVTAVSGMGNTSWTVVRKQQGTAAAPAANGASVKPTGADLNGRCLRCCCECPHLYWRGPCQRRQRLHPEYI